MTRNAKMFYDLDAAFVAQFGNIRRELVVPRRSMVPPDYCGLSIRVDWKCAPDSAYIVPIEPSIADDAKA